MENKWWELTWKESANDMPGLLEAYKKGTYEVEFIIAFNYGIF
jgi:hypothetical protein